MSEEVKIDGRTREGRAMKEAESKRADQVQQQRRRRRDNLGGSMKKLAVHGKLDRENYEYRWINSNRLYRMTAEDDWDIVTKDGSGVTLANPAETELGACVSRGLAGKDEDGEQRRVYLCRKPKDLFIEDRREKQRKLDALDAAIRGGGFDPEGELRKAGGNFYNPGGRRNTVE